MNYQQNITLFHTINNLTKGQINPEFVNNKHDSIVINLIRIEASSSKIVSLIQAF